MKPKISFSLILGLLFLVCLNTSTVASNGMHPEDQILFVKTQVELKKEPYYQAYLQLLAYADTALTQNHHALTDFAVPGFYVDPDGHRNNSRSLQSDSFQAYSCALAYRLSGKKKYGKRAIYFLNAWADKNIGYSEADGPLVMAYSGPGLLIAADLMKNQKIWKDRQQKRFENWVTTVYRKASNEIRNRKNNWADWGRYGSVLSAVYLEDAEEMAENIRLIKSDLFEKIAADGHMPEEVRRQDRGLWYTYFSLAPITAACWVILQAEGTDLLHWKEDDRSIKLGLDYLLQFVKDPEAWPWHENQRPGSPESWPGNLFEAMEGIYEDPEYGEYAKPAHPVSYPVHHFAWTFPTLMKPMLVY
ncbi:alginate lyase family protein [Lunatibacter salilacus]|uniref:alginate lyase family protein n=1 Tax=Lunatibacter salilacus TaxID=2483804 RepID=UPI001F2CC6E6|nr:alginate lyase family protein [Lunatibacter salilacus]